MVVFACCVPEAFSVGSDLPRGGVPPIPGKQYPLVACPQLGAVAAFDPQWNENADFEVRVQFLSSTPANTITDATLYYSWPAAPQCSYNQATGVISVSGTNLAAWPKKSINPNTLSMNTNWDRIFFDTSIPSTGSSLPDGTGKGIIIITTGGSQFVVNGTMILEYVH
jgi:hypothetical protein